MKIKIPRVSIVLPVYNREKQIARSINSILEQSFDDFELIVIDDCSTDKTEHIVRAYTDNRLHYIKLKANVGGAKARNIGIGFARAELVAFQDSDDEWHSNKLEINIKILDEFKCVSAICSRMSYEESIENIQELKNKNKAALLQIHHAQLMTKNIVGTPSLVVRRGFLHELRGFDVRMQRYQDWELALRLTKFGNLYFIEEALVTVHNTEGSISKNEKARKMALVRLYRFYIKGRSVSCQMKAVWLNRVGDSMLKLGLLRGRVLILMAWKIYPMNFFYLFSLLFMYLY
jgi:glycosyltransferase involved in cell wall biosynthesis